MFQVTKHPPEPHSVEGASYAHCGGEGDCWCSLSRRLGGEASGGRPLNETPLELTPALTKQPLHSTEFQIC